MGGGMSLHLGYRFVRDVAGVFALSSFLADESKVFKVKWFIEMTLSIGIEAPMTS